ncbi:MULTISPECIES: hypothetical protein [Streptomyces]|uniref:Uncharacterized protein n=1 Tax=Streptomyces nymphaeiformis TaxID=2663842 RepID=A0A7W7U3G3_9ACTN|nr:hypothetical protein [Streptomyces nymphaeiformis]MBB4984338.1 hypothetical protein [Streptomyces nymphaeiformis]
MAESTEAQGRDGVTGRAAERRSALKTVMPAQAGRAASTAVSSSGIEASAMAGTMIESA